MEIKDKRGSENVVADHLSCLESDKGIEDHIEIEESFPDEQSNGQAEISNKEIKAILEKMMNFV